MHPSNFVLIALVVLLMLTALNQYIKSARDAKVSPIYIAKPDWYVTDREWQPNTVLYDGGNLYYS